MAMTGKNRIMIYGSKNDGTYIVEFRPAAGPASCWPRPPTAASCVSRTDKYRRHAQQCFEGDCVP
jgi:hypothetical protein